MIVGADNSKIFREGWQAGRLEPQGRVDVAAWVQRQSRGRIPSSSGDLSLSFKAFNWLIELHPHYGELDGNLYWKSTDLNVSLI